MMSMFAVSGFIVGIISIVVGIIIIVWPRIVAYVIGGWLVLAGIFAILAAMGRFVQ